MTIHTAPTTFATRTGRALVLDETTIQDFIGYLRGTCIRPGDADYENARAVWNGMIDKRPTLIVRCADTNDVVKAVTFAREHELRLSVRGGGHNTAGIAVCDEGLVIDLSQMRDVQVDADARIAYAQGGVTWADLDAATQAYGLVTPGGVVSATGIAGLTLTGGMGHLRRKYGLSCDNLLALELVTADGRVRRVSQTKHPALFWALRGGGDNFGVVTAFEYWLHPLGPEIFFSSVFYSLAMAKEALQAFRTYAATAPDEVSTLITLVTVPDVPFFPAEARGQPAIGFVSCYAGPVATGERALQPLREFGTPLADLSSAMPYTEVQTFFDEDYPAGELRYAWSSLYLNNLSDDLIDEVITMCETRPSLRSTVDIWQMGGAISRVDEEATALSKRQAPFLLGVKANWKYAADDEANIAWARACIAAARPFCDGSQYCNFPGLHEAGDPASQAIYGYGSKLERLVTLKTIYDPTNLFRTHQNIKPEVV